MLRIKSALSLLLIFLIIGNVLDLTPAFSVSSKVKELVQDKTRQLYIDKVSSSAVPDKQEKKISVNLICKNLLKEPSSCADIFFFSLVDTSGNHYQAKLAESRIMPARIPTRDTVQGTLVFVIPTAQNATQLVYSEPKGSNFLVDLSSTKDPADKPPASEWRLSTNKGLTLSDSRIELKIHDETRAEGRYVLDISIRNNGKEVVDYNTLYIYLKVASGFVYGVDLYADVKPKIESGTLQPGKQVRGKIALDIGNESGPFMLIYDDIAGSYFATGKFVPVISSEVRGEIIGTAEDLVKIEKHNTYTDPITGTYGIIGEVSNNSENFVTQIQISTVLKDRSENVLAKVDYLLTNFLSSAPVRLAPNAKMPFTLWFNISKDTIKNIGSYELSLHYTFSEAKRDTLLVSYAELVQASKQTHLSKYILWQIKGQLTNIGNVRSTHTHITGSLYDSKGSVIGVGGFSVLDQQPRDLNPGQKKLFSIEISVSVAFQPSSFYLYAESDQVVIAASKTNMTEKESVPAEPLLVQMQNQTWVKIASKEQKGLLQFFIKNLPNSTASIYSIQVYANQTGMHKLKAKSGWDSKEIAGNELLLSTVDNPIKPGQKARFLFSVDNEVHIVFWKILDLNGTMILEGKVEPFLPRR